MLTVYIIFKSQIFKICLLSCVENRDFLMESSRDERGVRLLKQPTFRRPTLSLSSERYYEIAPRLSGMHAAAYYHDG